MPLLQESPQEPNERKEFKENGHRNPLELAGRVGVFWSRVAGLYTAYKTRQAQHAVLRLAGKSEEELERTIWSKHHAWAGGEMYNSCVELRGFFLKAGQFLGARPDFIPAPMCQALRKLHDEVPPMPPAKAREVIEGEMGGVPLEEVFEWIDLSKPLGSASIAQVHKAKLREDFDPHLILHRRTAQQRPPPLHPRSASSPLIEAHDAALSSLGEMPETPLGRAGGGGARTRPGDRRTLSGSSGAAGGEPLHGKTGRGEEGRGGGPERAARLVAGSVLGVVASAAIGAHEAACRLGLRHRRRNAVAGSEGGEAMGIRVTAQEAFQAPSDEAVPEDPFHIRSLPSSSRAPRWALRLRDAAARLREGRQAGAEEGSGTGVARRGRGGERVGSLLRVREGGGEARGEEDGTEEIESGKASTADAAEGEGRDKAKRKKSEHAGRVVAVKVQYPDALPLMLLDLKQLRSLASFLSACEIQFDLPSAVDELATQIRQEFDFDAEATTMTTIADRLAPLRSRVAVPRPIPGLVSRRLLAMDFLDGTPITKAAEKMASLSPAQRKMAAQRMLTRISEAYGHMILRGGLFQADCHPGNILIMKGGKVGLIDFGQSKQLTREEIEGLARLTVAATERHVDCKALAEAVWDLGVVTGRTDPGIYPVVARMATDMFDTRGVIDPFSPDSPIKQTSIDVFPRDLFFVLRTCQLLRGLKEGMGLHESWSSLALWRPLALKALS